MKLCYFPADWKHAIVVAVPEPNKEATLSSNYRPKTLLPTISKLFECVILSRIEKHMETTRIIPHEQFDFQKGHSTNPQLVRNPSGIFLLDVEKAYDSV